MGTLNFSSLVGRQLYLDANIFIYALERHADYATIVDGIFALIDSGQATAVTSEITLGECLVKPFINGDVDIQLRYQAAISTRPGFSAISVSRPILVHAAQLRALHKLRLPDAIHLATALASACQTFITNDQLIKPVPGITILQLADLTP